jgi:hypothetical protein
MLQITQTRRAADKKPVSCIQYQGKKAYPAYISEYRKETAENITRKEAAENITRRERGEQE